MDKFIEVVTMTSLIAIMVLITVLGIDALMMFNSLDLPSVIWSK